MKIIHKVAKYRCPNCHHIYKFNHIKKFIFDISVSFKGFKSKLYHRYQNAKATAEYIRMMKQQQKSNKK
jgi:hypothetical protein